MIHPGSRAHAVSTHEKIGARTRTQMGVPRSVCVCSGSHHGGSGRGGLYIVRQQYEGSHGRDEAGSGLMVGIGQAVVLFQSADAVRCADAASVVLEVVPIGWQAWGGDPGMVVVLAVGWILLWLASQTLQRKLNLN